jgi:CTP synthase
LFRKQNLDKIILNHFWFSWESSDLTNWNNLVDKIIFPKKEINVAIIWKYTQFLDTYKSISEALIHAWISNDTKIISNWIDSEKLSLEKLKEQKKSGKIDAILIPWWFWERWVEWKILAVQFAREQKIPFLWICLWLQVAVIEFARNICWLEKANSREFDENAKYKVIDFMEEQKNITKKWWTMRLWAYEAKLKKGSLAEKLYKITHPNPPSNHGGNNNEELIISERHRHRYEVNPEFYDILEKNWLIISGTSPDSKLVEFIELNNHPYFIATQAHPEFKSRLEKVHPLFDGLIRAWLENKKS